MKRRGKFMPVFIVVCCIDRKIQLITPVSIFRVLEKASVFGFNQAFNQKQCTVRINPQ
jgi:hypothetical protein